MYHFTDSFITRFVEKNMAFRAFYCCFKVKGWSKAQQNAKDWIFAYQNIVLELLLYQSQPPTILTI